MRGRGRPRIEGAKPIRTAPAIKAGSPGPFLDSWPQHRPTSQPCSTGNLNAPGHLTCSSRSNSTAPAARATAAPNSASSFSLHRPSWPSNTAGRNGSFAATSLDSSSGGRKRRESAPSGTGAAAGPAGPAAGAGAAAPSAGAAAAAGLGVVWKVPIQ